MQFPESKVQMTSPGTIFIAGWLAMMAGLTVSFGSQWDTFIHTWKPELFASVFLLAFLAYSTFARPQCLRELSLSSAELKLIIVPIAAFVFWSGISMLWAESRLSALHHTLIWAEYLIFYVVVRQILNDGNAYSKAAGSLIAFFSVLGIIAVTSYVAFLLFGGGTNLGIIYSKHGEQIVTLLPLFILGILRQSGRRLVIGATALTLLWLLVFSSQSRTGLFLFGAGFAAVTAFVVLVLRTYGKILKLAAFAALFIAVPAAIHFATAKLSSTEQSAPLSRLRDEKGLAGSNDFRRLMINVSAAMIADRPLIGIGADNFGFAANRYRTAFAIKDPSNPINAEAEATIPERAHNEYLQIAAELGIVGSLIFAWFFIAIAVIGWKVLRSGRRASPYAVCAFIGLVLFLASSVVTSYSFRFIQNGFVFFFVLAIAAKTTLKDRKIAAAPSPRSSLQIWKFAPAAAVVCIALAIFSIVRVTSVALSSSAGQITSIEGAAEQYRRAMAIDPMNPEAPYGLGLRMLDEGRYAEAVPHLRRSIDIGKARSADYSFLATAQFLAGDTAGAEATLAEAANMYPRSVFVLTRYSSILHANGKSDQARAAYERACAIDRKAASTWWELINSGARRASDMAFRSNGESTAVMDLVPYDAIFAVVAERDIRFPDERQKFPWERPSTMAAQ